MRARPRWVQGRPSGDPTLELWIRFKEPRDADLFALPLLVDAVFPAVMEIGATGAVTVELTVHVRGRRVPGWLACRVTTRHIVDGYHEEDFEIWDAAGRLVAQSRQLALLPPSAAPAALASFCVETTEALEEPGTSGDGGSPKIVRRCLNRVKRKYVGLMGADGARRC